MNPDLKDLYKKQYETLTDRLAKFDTQFEGMTKVTPEALRRVSVSGAIEGEDPLTRMNVTSNLHSTARSAVAQLETLQNLKTQLEAEMNKKEDEDTMSQAELQKEWLNGNPRIKRNPETGLLEIDYENKNNVITGDAAVAEVLKQGGGDILNQAKDVASRKALAEEIMRMGGVQEYKKQLPLDSLLTEKERTEIDTATDLEILVDQAIQTFSGGNQLGGTGPLAQLVPGFVAGEGTREMRRQASNIRAQYQKLISGATVSDAEAKRLEAFLPTSGKTEKENLEDLQQLARDLKINMEIYEMGKREGLTANEAYKKYGKQVFAKYGVNIDKVSPNDRSTLDLNQTGLDQIDEDLINKYKKQ